MEATVADGKSRGGGLQHRRLTGPAHRDRVLLAWHLALWWLPALGRPVIQRGRRPRCDRADRRARHPPLLFRCTAGGWPARGTP